MNQDVERMAQSFPPVVPDVVSCYGHAWGQFWKYFLELFAIGIISFFIGLIAWLLNYVLFLPAYIMQPHNLMSSVSGVIAMFYWIGYGFLLAGPIEYGISYAYLKAARRDQLKIKDMFAAFRNYLNAVLANLLVIVILGLAFGIAVLFGLVIFALSLGVSISSGIESLPPLAIVLSIMVIGVLCIPGLMLWCRLAFTPYLVVDRRLAVDEAIKTSWRLTRGHANKVFLIALLSIPITIAGFICLIVGVIPAKMWINTAYASLFYAISSQEEAQRQELVTN
jgi:uncharacterized membrane protein